MATGEQETGRVDLSALIEGLCAAGIEFVLVGGLAAVAQGAPITTMDVDIVHRRSQENIARLLDFLGSIDARLRHQDDRVIAPTAEHLSGTGHLLLATRHGPLDVLATIEGGLAYEDLLDFSVEITFHGRSLRVLALEKLVALKRAARDPKDVRRLPVLEETLRQAGQAEAAPAKDPGKEPAGGKENE